MSTELPNETDTVRARRCGTGHAPRPIRREGDEQAERERVEADLLRERFDAQADNRAVVRDGVAQGAEERRQRRD